MLSIHHVDRIDLPDLAAYRTLRQPTEHFRSGMFVAEGDKVVRKLLESSLSVCSVLLTPEWFALLRPLLDIRPEQINVYVASKHAVESIVGYNLHQGLMAVGKIPTPASLPDVLASSPRPLFLVGIDGLTNSENIGVLTRTCAAFGVHGILVGETSSSPYLRRAVRNSMGTVFHMPVIHTTNLVEAILSLQNDHGITVVAAHPHAERNDIASIDLRGDCCVVFGSEANGISQPVLDACGSAVAVPMQNGVDSLNVASAAAVFLYEIFRQRGKG